MYTRILAAGFVAMAFPVTLLAQSAAPNPAPNEVPIERCDRLPVVKVHIGSTEMRFLVDTGATTMLNLKSFTTGRVKEIQVTSWTGTAATSAREVSIPEFTLGSHHLRDLKLPAIDLSPIGNACGAPSTVRNLTECSIVGNNVYFLGSSFGYTTIRGIDMDLRILIVDDSETTRRILRAIIRSREWTVCGEAENGRSGIKQFQYLKPDLVLIDLAMPDINGIEAAKRMSTLNPGVPLILFTVLDLQGLEKAAREAGICAIVSKAQAWDLIKTIETAVTQFRGADQQIQ